MSGIAKVLRTGLFSAAMLGALGFGASQAAAAPQGAQSAARACSAYQDAKCQDYCESKGYDAGWCDPLYYAGCKCVHY